MMHLANMQYDKTEVRWTNYIHMREQERDREIKTLMLFAESNFFPPGVCLHLWPNIKMETKDLERK